MPLPPNANTYSGSVRGYWFIAPVTFTMTGLKVASEAGTGLQSIQVMKIHSGGVAVYTNLGTNFTTLYYVNNAPNNTVQAVSIAVNAGDTIGILGQAGQSLSYTASVAPYTTTIGGSSVVLNRFIYQGNIDVAQALEYSSEASGQLGRVEMYYTTAPCAGQPTAGTIPATLAVCPSVPFNITATGATSAGSMDNQWQSRNPAGTGTWTNVTGATMSSFSSPGITSATDYRYITKCTPSGLSDTSTVMTTTINPPGQCYCIPTYTYGCDDGDNINNVILPGDVSPGINNLNTPCNPTYYTDYTSLSATLTAGFTYNGNVTTTYLYPDENARIWIDYNSDGVFQSTEQIAAIADLSNTSTGAYTFTVPITQASGAYRMRVRLVYNTAPATIDPCSNYAYGETQDYTVNIIAATPCAGTPSAGTVPATLAVCPSVAFSLVTTGSTIAGNMTTQWQSRNPAGTGTWTDITGATAASYAITAGITTPTDYRYISKCITSGLSDTTTVMTTTINPANQCYCIPSGSSANYYIDTFTTALGSTNITNNGSGYSTNGYGDFTAQTLTQNQGSAVSFHAVYGSMFNTYGTKIWVDWNQDGVFADPGEVVYSTSNYSTGEDGTFVVPTTALAGTTRMRIGIDYNNSNGPATPCDLGTEGEYEDYTFVVTTPTCFVPTALIASNVNPSTATISWAAASPAPANGYEYYQSTSSTTPTAATVATGTVGAGILTKNLTALTPNTTYYYWVRSACSALDKSDWTLPISFTTPCLATNIPYTAPLAAVTPPAVPDCMGTQLIAGGAWSTENAPGSGFNGNTLICDYSSTTNESWVYTQGLNLTAGTSYRLRYDYGNSYTFYTEKLEVAYGMGNSAANMTTQLANYPSISSASKASDSIDFVPATTGVYYIGFKDYSDPYNDLLYLANITVTLSPPPCTGTPSAGTVPSTLGVCANSPFDLVASGTTGGVLGLTGQWQYRNPSGTGTWTNLTGATTPTYTVASALATPTDYRFILTCTTNSDTSNTLTTTINPASTCYCVPATTTPSYYIDSFATSGGTTNISNGASGYATNGYGVYTTQTVTQVTGGTVDFFGQYVGNTFGTAIWVDWNHNGILDDAGELVYSSSSYVSSQSGSFTVPTTALAGATRMRIGISYTPSTGPATPCMTNLEGEYEDYTFVVTAPCTPPIVNLGADTSICVGQSLTLDAGASNSTYAILWNNGDTTQTISVTTAGTYSVTVTNGTCITNDAIVVGVTPMPVVNLGNDTTICEGQTLTLHAANAGASYLWNDNSSAPILDVTTAGNYSVKVTNGNCVVGDTIMVSVDPLPSADTILAINSGGCNFAFSAINPQNITGYSWTFGDGSPNDTNAIATHSYAENGSYLAVLTMTNDCGTTTITTPVNCTDVGIGNINVSKDALKLYPNPTSDKITIENTSNLDMEYVTVFNVLGQVVYQAVPQSAVKHQMNVSNLASGLYTVRIKTDKGMVVRKFEILK